MNNFEIKNYKTTWKETGIIKLENNINEEVVEEEELQESDNGEEEDDNLILNSRKGDSKLNVENVDKINAKAKPRELKSTTNILKQNNSTITKENNSTTNTEISNTNSITTSNPLDKEKEKNRN